MALNLPPPSPPFNEYSVPLTQQTTFIFDGQWLGPPYQGFPALNRAFRFGDGCFETVRVWEGKPLFWDAHLDRLWRGMRALELAFLPEALASQLYAGARLWLDSWPEKAHATLRIEVFRAGAGRYAPETDLCHWIMEGRLLDTDPYASEIAVRIGAFDGFDLPYSPLSGLKLCAALPYVLAGRYAKKMGMDDAFLFRNGCLAEASASNVFLYVHNRLATPPLSSGCLDGVMRKQVIHLAAESGIPLDERPVYREELALATEVFLTNVARGIQSAAEWPGRKTNLPFHGEGARFFRKMLQNTCALAHFNG